MLPTLTAAWVYGSIDPFLYDQALFGFGAPTFDNRVQSRVESGIPSFAHAHDVVDETADNCN